MAKRHEYRRAARSGDLYVLYTPDDYGMEFCVLQAIQTGADNHWEFFNNGTVTTDPDEARCFVEGNVRWDGCVNCSVQEDDDCLNHYCGFEMVRDYLYKAFQMVYDLASREVGHWDEDSEAVCAAYHVEFDEIGDYNSPDRVTSEG